MSWRELGVSWSEGSELEGRGVSWKGGEPASTCSHLAPYPIAPEVVGTPIHTKLFIGGSLSLPLAPLLLPLPPFAPSPSPLTPSCSPLASSPSLCSLSLPSHSLSLLLLLAFPLPHRGGGDLKTYYNILMVIGSEREQAESKGSELGAF